MLIWGSATVTKRIGELPAFECRTCKTTAPHSLLHSYKWGHLWYLGAISDKSYFSVCDTCQTTDKLDKAKVEAIAKPTYPVNQQYGWAIWLVLLLVVGVFGVVSDRNTRETTTAYLTQPRPGDVYAVDITDIANKADEFHFALLRVKAVQSTELEFEPSSVLYNRRSGLTKAIDTQASSAGYFSADSVVIQRAKLDEMSNKGHIFEIRRLTP